MTTEETFLTAHDGHDVRRMYQTHQGGDQYLYCLTDGATTHPDSNDLAPDDYLALDDAAGNRYLGRIAAAIHDPRDAGTPAQLRALHIAKTSLELQTRHVVAEARDQGASWSQIGELLGMTRQAAQQRYRPVDLS